MNPTLHALVLLQFAGWLIFGLLMLNGAYHPDPAERAPAWPWGHVAIAFFWMPLIVLAVLVLGASFALEHYDRHQWRRRRARTGSDGTQGAPPSKTHPGGD